MDRGNWLVLPCVCALAVTSTTPVAAVEPGPVFVELDPATPSAIAPRNVAVASDTVRWNRLRAGAHRRDRRQVITDCRGLLREWRNDPRRADVLFFLGQISERRNPADQSPVNPEAAADWYDLAANAVSTADPKWLKYELVAIQRHIWRPYPDAQRLEALHLRLDAAEAVIGASAMNLARIHQTRFAVLHRQHDLRRAEQICSQLHEMKSSPLAAELSGAEFQELSRIATESSRTLLRAWAQAESEFADRKREIEGVGGRFAVDRLEIDRAIAQTARRPDGSGLGHISDNAGRAYSWLLLINLGFVVAVAIGVMMNRRTSLPDRST